MFRRYHRALGLIPAGATGSGMVNDFISNKSGKTKVVYDLPQLEPILKDTYGMIVYQEQVMQIASEVGGLVWANQTCSVEPWAKRKRCHGSNERRIFGRSKTKK